MTEFMQTALSVLCDAFIDTVKLIPFLYLAFYLMEYFEHKAGQKLTDFLQKAGHSTIAGVLGGAAAGCIPQCGFSAAASKPPPGAGPGGTVFRPGCPSRISWAGWWSPEITVSSRFWRCCR